MQMPDGSAAVVPRAKVTEYLLSQSHPDGRSKAEYLARFGFRLEDWGVLRNALPSHAVTSEVVREVRSKFGVRYVLEGPLRTPDGRNPVHRTAWIMEPGSTSPRLITAYPARRQRA